MDPKLFVRTYLCLLSNVLYNIWCNLEMLCLKITNDDKLRLNAFEMKL